MKKVGMCTLIWCVCCLFGSLVSNVFAQRGLSPEQNHTAEYLMPEEQSWVESAFYRTIVENNIFYPLGWTPPKPTPAFRLLGTVISTNSVGSQAILQEIASERLHFLRVGDSVGDATVTEILPKRVTLDKAGEAITFKLGTLRFLSLSRMPEPDTGRYRLKAQMDDPQAYKRPTDSIYPLKSASREERRRLIQRYYRK